MRFNYKRGLIYELEVCEFLKPNQKLRRTSIKGLP